VRGVVLLGQVALLLGATSTEIGGKHDPQPSEEHGTYFGANLQFRVQQQQAAKAITSITADHVCL
jgi:hypothetical protein